MKKIKYLVFMGALTIITLLANVTAAGACILGHYQPELPDELAHKYD